MGPDLGRLAVFAVDDMDNVVVKLLARPLGPDRSEHDRVIIADQDIVQLMLDRAARQLRDPAKHTHHLRHALIVTGERARAREMPDDVLGEELIPQRGQVATTESRANQVELVVLRS